MAMKRFLCSLLLLLPLAASPSWAKPAGYHRAEDAFENAMNVPARLRLQLLLIAAGYSNSMPNEDFSRHLFESIEKFQADNEFEPDGVLTPAQVRRLQEIAAPNFNLWGLQKVTHPSRPVTIWRAARPRPDCHAQPRRPGLQ